MRIAYLTTDEVNQDLAVRLAGAQGVRLEVLWPRDAPPDGHFDAVVYDLDSLPPCLRQQILSDLAAASAPWPVAVHSYALSGEQVKVLRGREVAVHPRLTARLLRQLRGAVRARSVGDRPAPKPEVGPERQCAGEPG
jgi:hypothetical protein